MNSFRVFIPIKKGMIPSHTQITETQPNGETKTRYRLQGIASTISLDRDCERVSKACLNDMVKKIKEKKLPIFGNHEHSWENMLGYADDGEVENNQMVVNIITDYAETNLKVPQLIGKLDAGMPVALSIGGNVIDSIEAWEPSLKKNIKIIEKVDLLETSIVGIASNPDAYLSLPTQIIKSLEKEEKIMQEKSAGQTGELSYGKLGETTPEARCPNCGRPGELRAFEDGTAAYLCNYDGTLFTVESQTKEIQTKPDNQPAKMPLKPIDQQTQEPLGHAKRINTTLVIKKNIKTLKGCEKMSIAKEAEAEAGYGRKKQVNAEAEAEGSARKEAEDEEEEDDEAEYKRFQKLMTRYKKEFAEKAEGVNTVPGAESANPQNTLGGSGGAASPVHAKSMADYESMKKAIKENIGVEGLETRPDKYSSDLSFKTFRAELMKK